jgi:molybdate transport system regulatory protein
MKSLKKLKVESSITIYIGEQSKAGVINPMLAALLAEIQSSGAIYQAVKKLHMAYSHAWKKLNEAEANLGFLLIKRKGVHGSALTPEGKKILEIYNSVNASGSEYIEKQFNALIKK